MMDDDLNHGFPESRPSGVLGSSSGSFSLGKFLAITAGLAAAAGVGALAYKVLATEDDPPPQPVTTPVATPPPPVPEEAPPPPPPRMDIGPPRLDIPDPSFDDPRDAPKPAAGPDIETPDW